MHNIATKLGRREAAFELPTGVMKTFQCIVSLALKTRIQG